jgi:hypothetical protein
MFRNAKVHLCPEGAQLLYSSAQNQITELIEGLHEFV